MAATRRPHKYFKWAVLGVATYGVAVTVGYQYFQGEKERFWLVTDEDRAKAFALRAPNYDEDIDTEEWFTGIKKKREQLISQAKGNVLEIAAGTGRNLQFFAWENCDKIVLSDSSEQMLEKAKAKAVELQAKGIAKNQILFKTADAKGMAQVQDGTFDTVIDTFGLCSFSKPVEVLKEMQRVCKKDGRILLLEHGRPMEFPWAWISHYLDHRANSHALRWGCWWNRDIQAIVKEAGLNIIEQKTFHLGTGYMIVAQPSTENKK